MISVTIKNRRAVAVPLTDVTTGAVGIPVHFRFSEDWDGLSKVAVFKTDSEDPVEMAILQDTATVPHEVLTTAYEILWIGIYGENAGGTVVIPTIWANAGAIQPGTESEAYDPAEPTPSWAAQVQAAAEEALEIANGIQERADSGDFDGADGQDGISPTASVSTISGGHRVTFTYGAGQTESFDVMDGVGEKGEKGDKGDKGDAGAQGPQGMKGDDGEDGATFIPSVSEEGIISWENDKGLDNPWPRSVVGPQGPKGDKGDKGNKGDAYVLTEADKQEIAGIAIEDEDVFQDETGQSIKDLVELIEDYTHTIADITGEDTGVFQEATGLAIEDILEDIRAAVQTIAAFTEYTGDTELSDTSEMWVQNKVVKAALDTITQSVSALDTNLKAGTQATAVYHLGFYLDGNGDLCQVED